MKSEKKKKEKMTLTEIGELLFHVITYMATKEELQKVENRLSTELEELKQIVATKADKKDIEGLATHADIYAFNHRLEIVEDRTRIIGNKLKIDWKTL